MQKHTDYRRGTVKTPCDLTVLLTHVVLDLNPPGALELLALLQTDLFAFREVVDQKTAMFHSYLEHGGLEDYAKYRQIQALISKNLSFAPIPAKERLRNTMVIFDKAERQCRRANKRLAHYSRHWSRAPLAHEVLNEAALLIQSVLPRVDDVIGDILDQCSFGPGTTLLSDSREDATMYHKISQDHSVTDGAKPWLAAYFNRNEHWMLYLVENNCSYQIAQGNRVSCVPKKWNVDRLIAVEPSFNVFLQKGVEAALKQPLRKVGLTIDDQSRNRDVAEIGSVTGQYATVDLSSASDTISYELVKLLLPGDWFELLDALRSKFYKMGRKGTQWYEYEKFSSMGNGFTFPLETLIFWAIARACLDRAGGDIAMLRVYGDDIVIDRRAALILFEVLRYAGFTPNPNKSFVFGPFRETCGADFVAGVDVRPIYLQSNPNKDVRAIYNLYNRLVLNPLCFAFPRTLQYLESLVHRPHKGPWLITMVQKRSWWESECNVEFERYFISDPPTSPSHRSFNEDYGCVEYSFSQLGFAPKRMKHLRHRYTRYLCFLLGLKGGHVTSPEKIAMFTQEVKTTGWLTLRDLYAFKRQPRREIRKGTTAFG